MIKSRLTLPPVTLRRGCAAARPGLCRHYRVPSSMKMQRCVWLARYGTEFGPPPATSGDNETVSTVNAVELKTKMQTHRDRHWLSRPVGLILRFASKSNINSSGHVLLSGGVAVEKSRTVPGCPAPSFQAERNRIGRGRPCGGVRRSHPVGRPLRRARSRRPRARGPSSSILMSAIVRRSAVWYEITGVRSLCPVRDLR
jgi:hypothetical protein